MIRFALPKIDETFQLRYIGDPPPPFAFVATEEMERSSSAHVRSRINWEIWILWQVKKSMEKLIEVSS